MKSWELGELDLKPRLPEILSSSPQARVIALDLQEGEGLGDHEVHERAWLLVVSGEVQVNTPNDERTSGGAGLLVELAPGERHEVKALVSARVLLMLTPWPGNGHPGAMTLNQKLYVRRRAAKHLHASQVQDSDDGGLAIQRGDGL
jgi:quercetin dioxygenase-like cupin family protein